MLFSKPAPAFKDVQQGHLTDSIDLGLRTVEVQNIVGSVNRWQDFDSQFRIRNRSTRYRYEWIKKAVERGIGLPPVELYKVKETYYVVDGNHRVSAAKQLDQKYIDAHVIEYLPPADKKEHLLWREKSQFERRTDLIDIEFSELGNFQKLLLQIEEFREEESALLGDQLSLTAAAQSWFGEIYEPVVKQIRSEKLLEDFPNRTEADLFLYASYHRMAMGRLSPQPINYREALQDLREQTPHRSLGDKITETISGLLHLSERTCSCPHSLVIDEDGLVRVTRECGNCRQCADLGQRPGSRPLPDDD